VVAIETLAFLACYNFLRDKIAFGYFSWDEILSFCIIPPLLEEYAKWYLIVKKKWHWFFTSLILTAMEGVMYGFIYPFISWAIWILMRRVYYYPVHILIARSYAEDQKYLPYCTLCHFLINFGTLVREPAWPIAIILTVFAFIPIQYVLLGCPLVSMLVPTLQMRYTGGFIFIAVLGILAYRVWSWYKCLS